MHGEAVHFYAGEKTVMWPKLTGYAYEIRSAGEPYLSQLLQYAESVCKQLEWTGLASFDFVRGEDGEFRFVDFNPRLWGAAGATRSAGVDLYGGLARWIRDGTAGPPSRPLPGISHRVFPKYTFEPSGMSPWRRLGGLRDAPWDEPSFIIGEALAELRARAGERIRPGSLDNEPDQRRRPCYNYGRFLRECVSSALNDQPGSHVRVLIIDDASQDDSAETARKLAAA